MESAGEQPNLDLAMVRVLALCRPEPELTWVWELRRLGAEVKRAFDAGQALEMMREHAFQAVFFDSELLPDNPTAFLDAAKQASPFVPCFAVCDGMDARRSVRLVEAGTYDCLARPFDLIRLWTALRNGLEWGRQAQMHAVRPFVDTQRPDRAGSAIRETLSEIESISVGETLSLAERQIERTHRKREPAPKRVRKYRIR